MEMAAGHIKSWPSTNADLAGTSLHDWDGAPAHGDVAPNIQNEVQHLGLMTPVLAYLHSKARTKNSKIVFHVLCSVFPVQCVFLSPPQAQIFS